MATGSMFVKRRFFGVSMATLVTKAIPYNFLRYKWLAFTLIHNIIKLTHLSDLLGAIYTSRNQCGEVWLEGEIRAVYGNIWVFLN